MIGIKTHLNSRSMCTDFVTSVPDTDMVDYLPQIVADKVAEKIAKQIVDNAGSEILKIIERRLIRQIKAFYGEGL